MADPTMDDLADKLHPFGAMPKTNAAAAGTQDFFERQLAKMTPEKAAATRQLRDKKLADRGL